MTLLRMYIFFAVLKGVALALGVLVSVGVFIELVGQLDDVGTASFTLGTALSYVALRLPRLVFEVLPVAALLGGLLSLGNMAVHRELVVMRASGVSQYGLLSAVALAGVALMMVMTVLGESLAPSLGAYAREMRTQALVDEMDLANARSAWLRQGDRIVHLQRSVGATDPGIDEFGGGVTLFELGEGQSLARIARADSAGVAPGGEWRLSNYAETVFGADAIEVRRENGAFESLDLNPDLVGLSVVNEDLLDTPTLRRYIEYLRANDLDADSYLIAYWTRMANIVSVLLMTVLALPFVFGGLRSAGTGARLLVGLVIGLSYYVVVELLANSGQVFGIDPRLVAWAPGGALLVITLTALSRVR